jgi:hypothetical protein
LEGDRLQDTLEHLYILDNMAAPRATQLLALRNLSRTNAPKQVRHLHMTGPATYASPILSTQQPQFDDPNDTASLRRECRSRKLDSTGTHTDLLSRLKADELSRSRAFSTSSPAEKEPHRPTARKDEPEQIPARHFNTSRSLQKPGDTSTIDFAYLPNPYLISPDPPELFRVPILPSTTEPKQILDIEGEDVVVMKPEISTMSADAVFLPMSEFTDGHAMNIDFHAMADRVSASLKRMQVPVDEQASMMKQIWGDIVDDVLAATKAGGKKITS